MERYTGWCMGFTVTEGGLSKRAGLLQTLQGGGGNLQNETDKCTRQQYTLRPMVVIE